MTILGRGDLAPQHRQSPYVRWLVGGLVLLLLAGGGYAAFAGLTGGSSKPRASTLPVCPQPSPTASSVSAVPPAPRKLVVKNATLRTGLAASVAAELKRRGFDVTSVGNTLTMMKSGVATVRYAPSRAAVARYVAAQVPGATLLEAPAMTGVEVDLGPGFKRLASTRDARAAFIRSLPPSPSATPTSTSTPTGSPSAAPTCRPRSVTSG